MITDLLHYPAPAQFDADVAIVGAGAAGITLARRLAEDGLHVCLLESGGYDYERPVQDLAQGTNIGFPYYALDESRLRFFGGTTAIWGGRSAELDAIDFEQRHWVSNSGWPFDKTALEPYYRSAETVLDLSTATIEDGTDEQHAPHSLALNRDLIETSSWWFDERFERFTLKNCNDLALSSVIQVVLHATAVRILQCTSRRAVEKLEIASLDGRRALVRARVFVLAAGGIENPRLLLAQGVDDGSAIGNEHDLVGRFFAEHPRARGGRIETDQPWRLLSAMPRLHRSNGRLRSALLRGSERLQREHGILNSAFALAVRRPPLANPSTAGRLYSKIKHQLPPDRFGRWVWRRFRWTQMLTRETLNLPGNWAKVKFGGCNIFVIIRGEQAPNRESRLVLDRDRDAFGMPRVRLDWRFSAIEKRTVRVLMTTFDKELARLGLGQLKVPDWLQDEGTDWSTDPLIGRHPIGGYHHMGTTRMAESPKHGVVDADSRVHGIENLYVLGSSVFPTGGWANPTLTILALALRLGDHLSSRLRR